MIIMKIMKNIMVKNWINLHKNKIRIIIQKMQKWNRIRFLKLCENKGSTIILIKFIDKNIFGIYNLLD